MAAPANSLLQSSWKLASLLAEEERLDVPLAEVHAERKQVQHGYEVAWEKLLRERLREAGEHWCSKCGKAVAAATLQQTFEAQWKNEDYSHRSPHVFHALIRHRVCTDCVGKPELRPGSELAGYLNEHGAAYSDKDARKEMPFTFDTHAAGARLGLPPQASELFELGSDALDLLTEIPEIREAVVVRPAVRSRPSALAR
jgi:hypothetical protein